MKKEKQVVTHICDFCDKDIGGYSYSCAHCGKDFCFDCTEKHIVEYHGKAYFQGSSDVHYCKECDKKLSESGESKLHNALKELKATKDELIKINKEYDNEMKMQEKLNVDSK